MQCFAFFLANSSRNALVEHSSSEQLFYVGILHVLRNYTSFLCRYGYVEKAIGTYQALLDFNLSNSSGSKELFELFWDMGLPKFGEEHSTGWLECVARRDKLFSLLEEQEHSSSTSAHRRSDDRLELIEDAILAASPPPPPQQAAPRIEYKWYEMERVRSLVHWYPFYPVMAAGETADDCADPDRLIAFDDDLAFLLFDVNRLRRSTTTTTTNDDRVDDVVECLKFKMLCGLCECLGWLAWDDESLDLAAGGGDEALEAMSQASHLDEVPCSNAAFERCLRAQFAYDDNADGQEGQQQQQQQQDMPLCGRANFFPNLFASLRDSYKPDALYNSRAKAAEGQLILFSVFDILNYSF